MIIGNLFTIPCENAPESVQHNHKGVRDEFYEADLFKFCDGFYWIY